MNTSIQDMDEQMTSDMGEFATNLTGVVSEFDEVKESLEENFDSLQQETNGKFGRTIYIFNIKLTQSMAIGQSQSEKKYY